MQDSSDEEGDQEGGDAEGDVESEGEAKGAEDSDGAPSPLAPQTEEEKRETLVRGWGPGSEGMKELGLKVGCLRAWMTELLLSVTDGVVEEVARGTLAKGSAPSPLPALPPTSLPPPIPTRDMLPCSLLCISLYPLLSWEFQPIENRPTRSLPRLPSSV